MSLRGRAGRVPAMAISLACVASGAAWPPAGAGTLPRAPGGAGPLAQAEATSSGSTRPRAVASPDPRPEGQAGTATPFATPSDPKAGRPAAPLPATMRVRVELNQLVQLHHWLLSHCGSPPRPDYAGPCAAYRELKDGAASPAVWQLANDACALGPDIAAVASRADRLPPTMPAKEAADARRLLGALSAAWPVYEKHDLVEYNRSLQRITVQELSQRFSNALEPRVMSVVYEKMLLRPLDQPVYVHPVTHGTHLGDWGKTARGYYLVQPMVGQPVIESLVHELTHVLESGQPAGERTFMTRLGEAGRTIPARDFEPFAHGLVVYNALETLRRATESDGVTSWPSSIQPWIPVYRKAWNPWLDGSAGADETVKRLVEGFLAQGTSTTAANP